MFSKKVRNQNSRGVFSFELRVFQLAKLAKLVQPAKKYYLFYEAKG